MPNGTNSTIKQLERSTLSFHFTSSSADGQREQVSFIRAHNDYPTLVFAQKQKGGCQATPTPVYANEKLIAELIQLPE